MHKFIILILLSFSTILFAQKVKPGEYISHGKEKGVKLIIKPDYSFELAVVSGKFEVTNDTLFYNKQNKGIGYSSLNLVPVSSENNLSFSLEFDWSKMKYATSTVYIALHYDNLPVQFEPLSTFFADVYDFSNYYAENEPQIVKKTIEKPTKISLFYNDYSDETTVFEFKIEGTHTAYSIENEYLSFSNMALNCYIDENENVIIAENKPILEFKKITATDLNTNSNENSLKSNWFKKSISSLNIKNQYNVDEDLSYNTIDSVQNYQFKPETFTNFNDALKKASDERFLVLYFNTDTKSDEEFQETLNYYSQNTSYFMYDGYDEKFHRFLFYKASEKDIKKWHKSKNPVVLILDKNQNIVFKKEAKINLMNDWFYYYGDFYNKLISAQKKATLDDKLLKKNENILEELTYFASQYVNIQALGPSVQEVPLTNESTIEDTAYITESITYTDADFYQLKASKTTLDNTWNSIFNKEKNKAASKNIAIICAKEVKNEGFNKSFFNQNYTSFGALQKNMLQYYLKNHKALYDLEQKDTLNVEYFFSDHKPLYIVDRILIQDVNETSKKEVITMFDTYFENNVTTFSEEIVNLSQNIGYFPKTTETYSKIERFFDKYFSNNANIIVVIDSNYVKEKSTESWLYYKANVADFLNSAAWTTLLHAENKNWHKTALNWSKKTAELFPESSYYLDTLGRLYYLDNQNEIAIETMKKAIRFCENNADYNIEEYKDVLESMKQGKEIFPVKAE